MKDQLYATWTLWLAVGVDGSERDSQENLCLEDRTATRLAVFRCRLVPMVDVAGTIRRHVWGILSAFVTGANNCIAEAIDCVLPAAARWVNLLPGRANERLAIYGARIDEMRRPTS